MAESETRDRYRILLAEDEAPLRQMLAAALRSGGYEVEAVEDGDAAREAYLRQCPDILLADLVMPGLNGQELAAACREHCPRSIFIFMSGYSEEDLQRLDIRQVVFIPKPVSPLDLLRVLDHLLQGRDSHPS